MEVATQATPATQDSNDTPATQGTIRVTRLDTLDTLRSKEVRGQGLVFLPRYLLLLVSEIQRSVFVLLSCHDCVLYMSLSS